MEKAIVLQNFKKLRELKGFDRVYFGNEFCYKKFPKIDEIKYIVKHLNNRKLTLITPFVGQKHITDFKTRLSKIIKIYPKCEIVFNDWGVLRLINNKKSKLKLSLGRLLNKQKKDPRLIYLKDRLPNKAYKYFKKNIIANNYTKAILNKFNVKRIELDNVLQGHVKTEKICVSLHYPQILITTSRMCMTNNFTYSKKKDCNFECRSRIYELKKPTFPKKIYVCGKFQYYINQKITKIQKNVDRLVLNE